MPGFKILLDECVDHRLAKTISHHSVKTVFDMGWSGLKNGELLTKAQERFDIFLTTDRNLSTQQNLVRYDIAILVLCVPSNTLDDLKEVLSKGLKQLHFLQKGKATFIK